MFLFFRSPLAASAPQRDTCLDAGSLAEGRHQQQQQSQQEGVRAEEQLVQCKLDASLLPMFPS